MSNKSKAIKECQGKLHNAIEQKANFILNTLKPTIELAVRRGFQAGFEYANSEEYKSDIRDYDDRCYTTGERALDQRLDCGIEQITTA